MRKLTSVAGAAMLLLTATACSSSFAPASSPARTACTPRWRAVAHGKQVPTLSAVVALSPKNVWAVGGYNWLSNKEKPVIAHWNGRALHVLQPFRRGDLFAVAGVAPNDVWAVGVDGSKSYRPVVAHWNGRRWALIRTPASTAQEGYLFDVIAFARNDAWAVGRRNDMPLVLRWNGKNWRGVPIKGDWSPRTELNAVDGTSSRDLWAVGSANYMQRPLALHWNGQTWREESSFYVSSVHSDSMELERLDVRSTNDVWALESITDHDLVLHWDGKEQHVVATSALLDDIATLPSKNVWAVGWTMFDHPERTYPIIARWNGKSWITQKTPLTELRNTTLEGLSKLSPNDIWAAGQHLIARYSCAKA